MKRLLHIAFSLLLTLLIASANPFSVRADGGDDEHIPAMEAEVNGIHVSLASQHEWQKGENTIIVTLMDSLGKPVTNADVEILIGAEADDHAEPEMEHGAEAAAGHDGADEHASMPGMEGHAPAEESHDTTAHLEAADTLTLQELGEHGIYAGGARIDSSGKQAISVMFHVDGEMLRADFVVEVPGVISKAAVLWGFAAINVVLIASASILKRQSVPVKGQ